MGDFIPELLDTIQADAGQIGRVIAALVILVDEGGNALPRMLFEGEEGIAMAHGCLENAVEHLRDLMAGTDVLIQHEGTVQ